MAEDLGTGEITITLDEGDVIASARDLGQRLERILGSAAYSAGIRIERNIKVFVDRINPVKLKVTADLGAFERAVRRLSHEEEVSVGFEPDVDRDLFESALQTALEGLEVSVRVVPDLDRFDAAVRAHNPPTVHVDVDVDRASLGRFGRAVGGLASSLGTLGKVATGALGIGLVGIAAASATASLVGLAAALAPAVGALAAGPAAILGFAAATATLKLALSGVGDALGAALTGDAAKFDKALQKLSPAARSVALEVRALRPEFDALRSSVQDALFTPLAGQATAAAGALGGPLKASLTAISGQFGQAAKQALAFAASQSAVSGATTVLGGTAAALSGLSTAAQPVLKGFLDIAAAVTDAFGTRLGTAIGSAGGSLGSFLTRLAESGRAVELVRGAADVFRQLGTVAANVGAVVAGVFRAADAAGGGLLANLGLVTGKFAEFARSAAGQQALGNVFRTLGSVAAQLGPILSALVGQLGAIAPALAPLFTAVGPAITSLINALGPALQGVLPGVQSLIGGLVEGFAAISSSGALATLGEALGGIGTALAPLLPLLGRLVAALGTALAPVLAALAAALAPVVSALAGALTPVLAPLTGAFLTLTTALTPVVTLLGSTLGSVVAATAPLLGVLAGLLLTVAQAVAPLITQVGNALVPILGQLAPVVSQLAAALAPLVTALVDALLPVLPPLVDVFLALVTAVVPLLPPLASLTAAVAAFATAMVTALAPALAFVADVTAWLSLNAVVPVIEAVVFALSGITAVLAAVIGAAASFAETVIGLFRRMAGGASGAVSGLVRSVTGFFTGLWSTLTGLASSGTGAVVGLFASLPGRARSAASGIVGALAGVFTAAGAAVVSRVRSLVDAVLGFLRGLPGQARSALSGAAGALVGAGADMMLGFIRGIRSVAGALVGAAKSVVSGAISGVKSLLHIGSPSKVFEAIGAFTGQGYIIGLLSTAPGVRRAADLVIGAVGTAAKKTGEASSSINSALIGQISKFQQALDAIGSSLGAKFIAGLTGSQADIQRAAEGVVGKIRDAFKGQQGGVADALVKQIRGTEKELLALADRRDSIAARIKAANEFAASTTSAALSTGALQNFRGGDIQGVTNGIEAALDKVKSFNRQVNDLAKRGLSKDLLAQLIGLGPDQGAGLAKTLSGATAGQLKDLNDAQKQLSDASRKLGRDSADNLFDAGKKASEGFLAGLKAQQKDVEDLMLTLAKGMAKAIRAALGIKSPSLVFRRIGGLTMDGLRLGVADRIAAVRRTAVGAAGALAGAFGGSGGPGPSGAAGGRQAAARGFGAVGGRTQSIAPGAIVVNEVGDGRATAERILQRLAAAGWL